jgi:hypothetical protein
MRVRCIRPDFSVKVMSGGSSGIEPEYLYTYKRQYKQTYIITNKLRAFKIEKILKKLEDEK